MHQSGLVVAAVHRKSVRLQCGQLCVEQAAPAARDVRPGGEVVASGGVGGIPKDDAGELRGRLRAVSLRLTGAGIDRCTFEGIAVGSHQDLRGRRREAAADAGRFLEGVWLRRDRIDGRTDQRSEIAKRRAGLWTDVLLGRQSDARTSAPEAATRDQVCVEIGVGVLEHLLRVGVRTSRGRRHPGAEVVERGIRVETVHLERHALGLLGGSHLPTQGRLVPTRQILLERQVGSGLGAGVAQYALQHDAALQVVGRQLVAECAQVGDANLSGVRVGLHGVQQLALRQGRSGSIERPCIRARGLRLRIHPAARSLHRVHVRLVQHLVQVEVVEPATTEPWIPLRNP